MGWAETRQRARRKVHSNFSFPATYFAPGAVEGVPCRVRLHSELQTFGDLDRELFAKVISNINRIVFDTTEIVRPRKDGEVEVFYDDARMDSAGRFQIANLLPKTNEFLRVEVTLL
jgi:hypothetical protein